MASTRVGQAVAAARATRHAGFFWRSSVVVACALVLMLLASGMVHAQSGWVRPAPPLVGYVGSSATPQLCQRTYPLIEGCWLGLDPQVAIDKVCALHGDTRGADAALPVGEKLFTAEVQCKTQRVGIAGQPFYCDSSGLVEAKYIDDKTGKIAFSCTQPPSVLNPNKNMGCPGCSAVTAADGINLGVGNAYRYETDFRSSANPLLEIRRLYNSLDLRPRAFGFNWVGSYERRLEIFNGLRVVAWRPDANMYYFDEVGGKFIADVGVKDALVKVVGDKAGVAWRYTSADRVVEEYNARGVLIGMRHPQGAAVRLEYSDATSAAVAPGAGYLLRVLDSAGRAVSFSYDREGRIIRAVDTQGGIYVYTYGGVTACRAPQAGAVPCASGNLTSVLAEGGPARTYHYDEAAQAPITLARALTGISAANGKREVSWTYDLNGKAVGSSIEGGARKVALEKSSADANSVVVNITEHRDDADISLRQELQYGIVQGVRVVLKTTGVTADNGCPDCRGTMAMGGR